MKTRKFSFAATILYLCTALILVGCTKDDDSSEQQTLTIASMRAKHVTPQPAFWVKVNDNKEWELFYGGIDGFTYEEGYEYKVLVSLTPVENPGPDMSSIKYTLIKLLSKEKKDSNVPITTKDLSSIPKLNEIAFPNRTKEIITLPMALH